MGARCPCFETLLALFSVSQHHKLNVNGFSLKQAWSLVG